MPDIVQVFLTGMMLFSILEVGIVIKRADTIKDLAWAGWLLAVVIILANILF